MPVVRESETVAPSGEPGLELPDGSSAVCKPKYKHVPHRLKPAPVVERRNARERKRVEGVNSAFTKLRALIPYKNRHKRLSKVKTLNIAIDYIRSLEQVLKDDELISSPSPTSHAPAYYDSAMSSPASVTSSVTWESDGPYPDQVAPLQASPAFVEGTREGHGFHTDDSFVNAGQMYAIPKNTNDISIGLPEHMSEQPSAGIEQTMRRIEMGSFNPTPPAETKNSDENLDFLLSFCFRDFMGLSQPAV